MSKGIKIRLVVSTRMDRETFLNQSATGRSFTLYEKSFLGLELCLFEGNTQGLPSVYNAAIQAATKDPAILIFVHDDVHLTDFTWPWKLAKGLDHFQIVGPVGSVERAAGQVAWCYRDTNWTNCPDGTLSGVIGVGSGFPPLYTSYYGPQKRPVRLLDGVFLAAYSETLLKHRLMFDERFLWDFYDMDFCRQAETLGLSMGTWNIGLVHESKGNFGTQRWLEGLARYQAKWRN